MSLVYRAKNFAEKAHAEQRRKYTGEPYSVHLREVARLCAEVGADDEVVAAAWLHDVVEDQPVTVADVEAGFGLRVARLVDEVTDRKDPGAKNRDARKAVDRAHLAGASPDGMTIKLADMISNGADIALHDRNFAVRYMGEMALLLPLLRPGNPGLWARAEAMLDRFHRSG